MQWRNECELFSDYYSQHTPLRRVIIVNYPIFVKVSAVPAKIFTTENTERTERGMGKTKHDIFLSFLCVLCALCGSKFLKISS